MVYQFIAFRVNEYKAHVIRALKQCGIHKGVYKRAFACSCCSCNEQMRLFKHVLQMSISCSRGRCKGHCLFLTLKLDIYFLFWYHTSGRAVRLARTAFVFWYPLASCNVRADTAFFSRLCPTCFLLRSLLALRFGQLLQPLLPCFQSALQK